MGLDPAYVRTTLQQAHKLESVRNAIKPLPAGVRKNWQSYRAHFINEQHVRAGTRFWSENEAALALAANLYGVPEPVIMGILGMETLYGQNSGNYRVLDALASLAFDFPEGVKDRSAYFRGELAQFFLWCARSQCAPLSVHGSYAGAIGMPQFMPDNIDRFGADLDGDGRVNLQSPADAIGSVARYLALHGWARNLPPCISVDVDNARLTTLLEPDIVPSFDYWQTGSSGRQAPRTHSAVGEIRPGGVAERRCSQRVFPGQPKFLCSHPLQPFGLLRKSRAGTGAGGGRSAQAGTDGGAGAAGGERQLRTNRPAGRGDSGSQNPGMSLSPAVLAAARHRSLNGRSRHMGFAG